MATIYGPLLHMMTIRVNLISNLSNLRREGRLKTYNEAVLAYIFKLFPLLMKSLMR